MGNSSVMVQLMHTHRLGTLGSMMGEEGLGSHISDSGVQKDLIQEECLG